MASSDRLHPVRVAIEVLAVAAVAMIVVVGMDTPRDPAVHAQPARDSEVWTTIGQLYRDGRADLPRDFVRARECFARASRAQRASGSYYLGVMSLRGEGEPASAAAAARWFSLAAEQGSAQATFLLANAYRDGSGVPRDPARAVALYTRAGELELPAALQALQLIYERGELGVEPDPLEAQRYAMETEHALAHSK